MRRGNWNGDIMVAEIEEFMLEDSMRRTSSCREHFIFPIADGTVELSVRDQVFRRTQRRFFKESRTGLSR